MKTCHFSPNTMHALPFNKSIWHFTLNNANVVINEEPLFYSHKKCTQNAKYSRL